MKRYFFVLALVALAVVIGGRALLCRSPQVNVPPAEVISLNEESLAAHLSEALRLPTISHFDSRQTDVNQLKALSTVMERRFPLAHAKLKRDVIAGYSFLYEWTGQDKSLAPILLLAHMDVVPIAEGTEKSWQVPPFSGAVKDGYVWGRGAIDDKSSVFGILEAVEWLLAHQYVPKRTLLLAFGHDEEVGGPGGAKVIAANLKARGIKAHMILDEGGVISEGMLPDVTQPVAFIGTAEKGYLSVEMTVKAQGGHSSMPVKPTAIGALARAVRRLETSPLSSHLVPPTEAMLTTLAPHMPFAKRLVMANLFLFDPIVRQVLSRSPSMDAMIRSTTAPTVFHAGEKDNVMPAQARATVNFRILPGESVESVMAHVSTVVDDASIHYEPHTATEPSPVSAVDGPAYRQLERSIRRVFPEALVSPYLTLGGTDTKHYKEISSDVYRFLPLPMRKEDMGRFHGTDERIGVKDYANMVRFYIDFLREGGTDTTASTR